ncbi:MAG: hypothetical protein JNM41_07805 [Flavipsychrobacter sp.]|nr:hypothetical protein [Flavipsychrobacter sp.]
MAALFVTFLGFVAFILGYSKKNRKNQPWERRRRTSAFNPFRHSAMWG